MPELAVGTSPEDQATGRYEWDPDLSDGFDSGWVSVELDVYASGGPTGVVWSVNHVEVPFASPAYGEIQGFSFRVGVGAPDSTVSFRNLSAEFFQTESDIAPAETIVKGDGSATTVGSDAASAEAVVEMLPAGSGYQKARVFAEVRMQSPYLPDPTDLFGQVLVYAA